MNHTNFIASSIWVLRGEGFDREADAVSELRDVVAEALEWCKIDAENEDGFPSQEMMDARVERLKEVTGG